MLFGKKECKHSWRMARFFSEHTWSLSILFYGKEIASLPSLRKTQCLPEQAANDRFVGFLLCASQHHAGSRVRTIKLKLQK